MALGNNPLTSKGIFDKTEPSSTKVPAENQESRIKNQGNKKNRSKTGAKAATKREKVNLRLPIKTNDWLNDLVLYGKRHHGRKIPKEIWVTAALQIMRKLPINWKTIRDEEHLEEEIEKLLSQVQSS